MGGQQFTTFAKGASPKEAFSSARDRAQYDHGHGGYTGTIAEKPGFKMRDSGEAMTMKEAKTFAEADGMDNEKWGDAYCVMVRADDSNDIIGYLFYGWASS